MANPILTSDLLKNEGDLIIAIEELQRLREEYKGLMKDVTKNGAKLQSSIKKATSVGANSFKRFAENEAKKVDNLKIAHDKYTEALSDNGKQLAELKTKLQEVNREQKLNAQAVNSATGSHRQLSAQHSLELIKLKKLSGAQRENTKEGRKQVATVKALSDQLKKIEKDYGRTGRNVGNYDSANKKLLGTLKQLAAVYLSVEGIRRFGRLIFDTTKEVNSLNSAYEKVILLEADRADTMRFLNDVSERYGTNINVLRRSYLRFTAATKSSNLTMEQRKQIFDTMAKATTALELGTEKTSRVFNAIEQIMSKGVVSSEELRQQLGDSLPGSLELMADALGVTTFELDKMLKKGEVISEDAMPKFAAQIEKVYGLESINKIENLSTAQGRFENSIINTIAKLEASDLFENMYNNLANIINIIGDNIKSFILLAKSIGYITAAYLAWNVSVGASTALGAVNITTVKGQAIAHRALAYAVAFARKSMIRLNASMRANKIGAFLAIVTLLIAAYDLLSDTLLKTEENYRKTKTGRELLTESINEEVDKVDKLNRTITDLLEPMELRKEALMEMQELYPEIYKGLDIEKVKISDLKDAYEDLKEAIKTTKIAEQKDLILSNIADAQKELKKLEETLNNLNSQRGKTYGRNERGLNSAIRITENKIEKQKRIIGYESVNLTGVVEEEKRLELLAKINKQAEEDAERKKRAAAYAALIKRRKKESDEAYKKREDLLKSQELELSILDNGLKRELGLLEVSLERKRIAFEKADIDVTLIESYGVKKREEIYEKYSKYRARVIAKIPTLEAKAVKDTYDNELKTFDLKAKSLKSEFELLEKSEKQKTVFKLEQERDRIQKLLDLNDKYHKDLSKDEKDIFKNNIQRINNEINETEDVTKDFNIYDKLGFTEKEGQAIGETMGFLKTQMTEFFSLRTELADKRVESADREVDAAQNALNREVEYQTQGFASNVALKEKELAAAQKIQKKAEKEQEKARRAELAAQSVVQGVNLITGASKIAASAPLLAPVLIPLMFGAFIAAKVKAFQLSKQEFSEGGYEVVGGGSHASGNDTDLGFSVKGKRAFAEKDEGHMILRPSVQRKYSDVLPLIYNALDNGVFNEEFGNNVSDSDIIVNGGGADMSGTESLLGQINNKTSRDVYLDGEGNTVIIHKNIKTTYV